MIQDIQKIQDFNDEDFINHYNSKIQYECDEEIISLDRFNHKEKIDNKQTFVDSIYIVNNKVYFSNIYTTTFRTMKDLINQNIPLFLNTTTTHIDMLLSKDIAMQKLGYRLALELVKKKIKKNTQKNEEHISKNDS